MGMLEKDPLCGGVILSSVNHKAAKTTLMYSKMRANLITLVLLGKKNP